MNNRAHAGVKQFYPKHQIDIRDTSCSLLVAVFQVFLFLQLWDSREYCGQFGCNRYPVVCKVEKCSNTDLFYTTGFLLTVFFPDIWFFSLVGSVKYNRKFLKGWHIRCKIHVLICLSQRDTETENEQVHLQKTFQWWGGIWGDGLSKQIIWLVTARNFHLHFFRQGKQREFTPKQLKYVSLR